MRSTFHTLRLVAALGLWAAAGVACPPTTGLPEGPCGDGERNKGEQCDDGVLNSDVAADACRSDCQQAHCGDQVIDTGEECDGENLAGQTCLDFGFDGGSLICDPSDCTILTRHCTLCGDDLQAGSEACDGIDLAGLACTDLGFGGGTLACATDCTFDLTGCDDGCGNGRQEGTEECDGADLGQATCESLGFESGTLACTAQCRFDRHACVGGCGNGVVEVGEACDDGNDVAGDGCTDCRAGDGTFTLAAPLPTGTHPVALRLADVDGDGAPDLVVGYAGEAPAWGGVAVHRNLGNRLFGAAERTELDVRVSALAVDDLDGDGALDVAVTYLGDPADDQDPGGLIVLQGTGTGSFDSTVLYTPGTRPVAVEAGLLSGSDAYPDLVVLNQGSSSIALMSNDGTGTLTAVGSMYAFGWPTNLTVDDLDGDGRLDVAVSRSLTSTVALYLNTGTGFATALSRYAGARPAGIAAGRVDDNDTVDLIVALAEDGAVVTLAGDGLGGFGYPLATPVGGSPTLVVAERFNADPALDVVVADGTADTLRMLLGVGDGSFTPSDPWTVGDSPSALRTADLDGDGIGDLAVTCAFSHDVWILWGHEQIP